MPRSIFYIDLDYEKAIISYFIIRYRYEHLLCEKQRD